ncbi:MBL fold metallo-hydrolase [Luteolibacter sp. GHJ8]|uniref:MBL fold metallo-hydrolase n=1 Tax=Luteolibacter rhizosphaerae TaxID=2989719 RepID=A0ABT3G1H2_9BACT|nr:MBL fold metallo-hydrolase [Luteolibacter rhizosphaerae]MCW1913687.1 MBL fold metallo-hydrolase [Luteolibacter rhizosphaerae]
MRCPGLIRVQAPGVSFHALRHDGGIVLVDCGFVGGVGLLARALRLAGWEHLPLTGIVLTHGHLDHILNVGRLAAATGAWIAAPRLDSAHYEGRAVYRGASRVTGVLESLGRPLLGFQAFAPDRWIDDGDEIEVWDGLRAIHLPGHTAGHMGYYCERHRLLFCADLFASYPGFSHLPPAIFNVDGAMVRASVVRALALDPVGVLPNHGDSVEPELHLSRLHALARRQGLA